MARGRILCILSVLSQVLLIASLTLFWLQLLVRALLHAAEPNPQKAGPVMATSDVDMESFARLSLSLFEKRHDEPDASSEPSERSYWNEADQLLESVQIARVPQAGGRHLSAVARRLVGCSAKSSSNAVITGIPGCRFPGDPALGCPGDSLCPKVVGFSEHLVDTAVLANENVISLSQLRAPVERLVSAFSFGNEPHSPPCARRSDQHEVQECFTTMAQAQGFRNVAGRAYTGHDAYAADVSVCRCEDEPSVDDSSDGGDDEKEDGTESRKGKGVGDGGERDGGKGGSSGGNDRDSMRDSARGSSSESCQETLESSLAGLCLFNHVALAEAPGTSAVLLLETLRWVRPDASFFSELLFPRVEPSSEEKGTQGNALGRDPRGSTVEVSRHGHDDTGTLHQQYITKDLRDSASAFNQVDEFLYDVVSAKMCSRLSELGLLEHPAVQAELATSSLQKRCASREWVEGILDSVDGVMDTHRGTGNEVCRLLRPVPRPPRPVR